MLPGSRAPLCQVHDRALVDLDGVVYVGEAAVPGAVDALARAARAGMAWSAVTNNALRPPAEVADHLTRLGVPATAADVVTSAMAAARVLAERIPTGSSVLVCGGRGLDVALQERGLVAVAAEPGAADHVDAVVSGHDPATDYRRLAEACLALRRGVLWVASNTDANAPGPRGPTPGAGAVVAFLATASGRDPDAVAGKPHPAMHEEMVQRSGARHPLVVGDRLDTDIAGARRAGVASLAVLSGVVDAAGLLTAPPAHRPDHLARDLGGITSTQPPATVHGSTWQVRAAGATVAGGALTVSGAAGPDGLDLLRAACAAAWDAADRGSSVALTPALLAQLVPARPPKTSS